MFLFLTTTTWTRTICFSHLPGTSYARALRAEQVVRLAQTHIRREWFSPHSTISTSQTQRHAATQDAPPRSQGRS
ncbi:hypothetical protein A4X06_0g5856 [Tilletia controversa]|uniref:Uncharacterized protein n=2 Tax=Tilletia TaxID=13289 RepID=A0A8X7MQ38_9BASI|nr:hypothetical protein A4X06_0g5856 [Tilletia controversa]KAE8257521.1 hypothetical protein A4X03_0g4641 [Tilletia caries]